MSVDDRDLHHDRHGRENPDADRRARAGAGRRGWDGEPVSARVGYHWHLRRLMADRGLFATTALVPLLAERGVRLSREQVYPLVTGVPERLSLATLAALCDILDCTPMDLVEPYRGPATPRRRPRAEITILPGSGTRS